jgi:hypothetical protein
MSTFGKLFFVLWCLAWLPTVVGLFRERPGVPPAAQETAIRLTCLGNAFAFYLGGMLWLGRQCVGQATAKVCLAWVVFLFWNSLGPVVLAICWWVLRSPLPADTETGSNQARQFLDAEPPRGIVEGGERGQGN